MKPFLLLAMPFIILQDPSPGDSIRIASLLCVLLRFQWSLDMVGELPVLSGGTWWYQERKENKVKMKFLSMVLNFYLCCTAVIESLCSVESELPPICYAVLVVCSLHSILKFACFK